MNNVHSITLYKLHNKVACRASRDEHVERDECVEPCFSNMADDEEAVLACTSFIVCALCVHVNKKEKRQHAVWVKDYLKKRDFWVLQFFANVGFSKSQSDLVELHAHRYRAF